MRFYFGFREKNFVERLAIKLFSDINGDFITEQRVLYFSDKSSSSIKNHQFSLPIVTFYM